MDIDTIFDIWRLVVKSIPVIGITGVVMYIMGIVGDPNVIKNKKGYKKWGIILTSLTFLMIIVQIAVTYFLLLKY